MPPRFPGRIGLGLLSLAGMSAGHFASYLIAAPDPHHRAELLESTGHAGESPFLVIAIAALIATCIAALLGRTRDRAPGFVRAAGALLALQSTAFVGLETIERLTVQTPLLESMQEPVFLIGLGVQLMVALLGALILRSLHTAATTISARPPAPSFVAVLALAGNEDVPARSVATSWDARAPPASS